MKVVTQKSNWVGVWFNTFTTTRLEKTKKKTTPEMNARASGAPLRLIQVTGGLIQYAAIWDLKG